jgi:hypothetical protein
MIEGTVEAILPDRHVLGWLRDTDQPEPSHVQLRIGKQVVAETVADAFRPDLLRQGHGHGHYGFRARLRRDIPAGPVDAMLFLPEKRSGIRVRLAVPPLQPRAVARVEALLREEAGWTAAHLLAHPDCLALDASLAAMGTARFLDAVFRFALHRWPEAAEAAVYGQALESHDVSPQALLVELLSSRERSELPDALVSPWHPEFPFPFHDATATAA